MNKERTGPARHNKKTAKAASHTEKKANFHRRIFKSKPAGEELSEMLRRETVKGMEKKSSVLGEGQVH